MSGGLDSVVLLDVLHKLGAQVAVAHCHFGLRGEEADADEQFVRKLAKQYGLPYFAEFFQTKEYAEQEGISTQMAARFLRYRWFEQVRAGAGPGLRRHGPPPARRGRNHAAQPHARHRPGRPARHSGQKRPRHPAAAGPGPRRPARLPGGAHGLRWREDASNDSPVYQRNLLRHEVLPVLREINPNLDQTMHGTAERVGGAEEIVRRYVADTAAQARRDEAEVTYLNIATLQKTAATALVLHEMLRPFGFSWLVVKDIVAAFGGESGRRFDSPTHRLVKDREHLVITPRRLTQFRYTFQLAGGPNRPAGRRHAPARRAARRGRHFIIPRSKSTAALDADKLKFPLTLRRWQEGDWFMPTRHERQKAAQRLPHRPESALNLKDDVRVLTSADGKICWVVGWRVDERFKVEETERERVLTDVQ